LEHKDGETGVDAEGRQRGDSDVRSVDDRRIGGFRGPLVFGVIAATIEMGIILALLYC
jgi:hypothetical protein